MTSKRNALRHPIRDGFSFLAAVATAVAQLFVPTARQASDALEDEETEGPGAADLKKRVAPYPVED